MEITKIETDNIDKPKFKNQNSFFSKIKKIKNIEIIIGIIMLCVILLVFLNGKNEQAVSTDFSNEQYTLNLEKKLCLLLEDMAGVGKVSAMITLESGLEYIPLTNKEIENGSTSNGNTITKEEIIMVSGKPFILKEKYPKIAGVVIVCSGGDKIKIKLEILRATTALLNVENGKIEILTRK